MGQQQQTAEAEASSALRHTILAFTVAALMAIMMATMATPAFAKIGTTTQRDGTTISHGGAGGPLQGGQSGGGFGGATITDEGTTTDQGGFGSGGRGLDSGGGGGRIELVN